MIYLRLASMRVISCRQEAAPQESSHPAASSFAAQMPPAPASSSGEAATSHPSEASHAAAAGSSATEPPEWPLTAQTPSELPAADVKQPLAHAAAAEKPAAVTQLKRDRMGDSTSEQQAKRVRFDEKPAAAAVQDNGQADSPAELRYASLAIHSTDCITYQQIPNVYMCSLRLPQLQSIDDAVSCVHAKEDNTVRTSAVCTLLLLKPDRVVACCSYLISYAI